MYLIFIEYKNYVLYNLLTNTVECRAATKSEEWRELQNSLWNWEFSALVIFLRVGHSSND